MIELFAEEGLLHSMMEDEPTLGRPAIRRRLDALCPGATEVRIKLRNADVVNGSILLERVDNFGMNGYHRRASLLHGMVLVRDFVHEL